MNRYDERERERNLSLPDEDVASGEGVTVFKLKINSTVLKSLERTKARHIASLNAIAKLIEQQPQNA